MKRLVFLLLLGVISCIATPTTTNAETSAGAASWTGILRVGDAFHDVKIEQFCAPDACEMTVVVYRSRKPLAAALVRVTDTGGDLRIGSERYPLDAETARRWLGQLRVRSICEGEAFVPTDEPPGCRSPDLHEFVEGLAGKIEETRGGPTEIRFFSLDEWPNPFGELVTLGLSCVDQEGEDAP